MKKIILSIIATLSKIGILTPIVIARLKYFYKFHKWPDYEHPHDLNEKINWLKFYGDTTQWSDLADKYKVREYVKSKGLSDILVKSYGKWDRPEDIELETLPEKFVLKANNGCGDVLICRDKSKLKRKDIILYFSQLLNQSYGIVSGEPHYAKIKPCIVAEELLDSSTQLIKSSSIIDYKIWCFNGVPYYTFVCYNRTKENTNVAIYDYDWNYRPEYSKFNHHYDDGGQIIPRPSSLDEMYRVAKILSQDFPVVRVDLYEVDGKVYFGELTFTSLGGFMDYFTEEFLKHCGSIIKLPCDNHE